MNPFLQKTTHEPRNIYFSKFISSTTTISNQIQPFFFCFLSKIDGKEIKNFIYKNIRTLIPKSGN